MSAQSAAKGLACPAESAQYGPVLGLELRDAPSAGTSRSLGGEWLGVSDVELSQRQAGRVAADSLRLAELVAALSLGVDLGFGQPMEHVLRES